MREMVTQETLPAGRAVNATCGEKHFACLNFLPVAVWSENWIDFLN